MGRSPCCAKVGLNRGAWTAIEDKILTDYINAHGEGQWRDLPKKAGLKRCGKSCRLRWLNYLRPDIKRGNISADEEDLIIRLHKLLGNRWSLIAGRLPGRTDNEIKNYWNTNLGKKAQDQRSSNKPPLEKKSENATTASSAESKISSSVVRTKATKCSRVVLDPELYIPQQSNNWHVNNKIGPSRDYTIPLSPNNNQIRSNLIDNGEDIDNDLHDLMIDFNVEELNCLSELLNSEFSDFSPPSGNELPPLFSEEEVLQDWKSAQTFGTSNLNPLTSVLDSVGDWLEESSY